MTKLLFSIWLIFPMLISAQSGVDTIIWSAARSLTWDDFKGNYDTAVYNRQHLAVTLWKLQYQYKPEPLKNRMVFIVYAWFDANKSWVRRKKGQSKSLLQHEQGHFDLAELFARQLRKQFSETVFNMTNYKDSISQIFSRLLTIKYAQQWQYDKETIYGMKDDQQHYWQSFIKAELQKLDSYQDKNFTATLSR